MAESGPLGALGGLPLGHNARAEGVGVREVATIAPRARWGAARVGHITGTEVPVVDLWPRRPPELAHLRDGGLEAHRY